jgi:CDGSH-type Zn-finger protein
MSNLGGLLEVVCMGDSLGRIHESMDYYVIIIDTCTCDLIKNKPVGDGDHEVLGMGSFGEYKLYGKSTYYVLLVPVTLQGLNTELVYF